MSCVSRTPPRALTLGPQTVSTEGLVDSGSDVNVLPWSVGNALAATWDLRKGTLRLGGTLAGTPAMPLHEDEFQTHFQHCVHRYLICQCSMLADGFPGIRLKKGAGFVQRDAMPEMEFISRHRNEPNIYVFVRNNPINSIDPLGLWATDVHHQIVEDWLADNPYARYRWRCCTIPVKRLLKEGSDAIDGVDVWVTWPSTQSSANSYEHAMKSPAQTPAQAQALYTQFLNNHIQRARDSAARGRARRSGGGWDCTYIYQAIRELGMAYHGYSDESSSAHAGFQTWYGPVDGVQAFGAQGYWDYIQAHKAQETMQVYSGMKSSIVSPVRAQFQGTLDELLAE